MDKKTLVSTLKNEADISKTESAKVIEIFFDSISKALSKGDRIEIRGLCSFFVKKYKGYTGTNPKTGEKIHIKPKKLPVFKFGRELKGRINNGTHKS